MIDCMIDVLCHFKKAETTLSFIWRKRVRTLFQSQVETFYLNFWLLHTFDFHTEAEIAVKHAEWVKWPVWRNKSD